MQGHRETPRATLARTLAFTNDYIAIVHERASMFATVFFAVLDPTTGVLVYANAGHDAPMLWRYGAAAPERLMPTGAALGLFPGISLGDCELRLLPGDVLLAYTDGVIDATGATGKADTAGAFGEARLLLAASRRNSDGDTLLAGVTQALDAHVSGAERQDDITLLALVRKRPVAG